MRLARLSAAARLALGVALVAPLGAAGAQLNFTFAYSGLGGTASGTLFTNGVANANGYYTVTGITGTRNGASITALLAPLAFDNNDNLLRYPAHPYVDVFGISYLVGSLQVNFFNNGGNYIESRAPVGQGTIPTILTSVTVTPAAVVPEPGTWALVGAGLLGVGGVTRRRVTRA